MCNSKSMMVLETMDYSMMDIINDGPHVPMYQPQKTLFHTTPTILFKNGSAEEMMDTLKVVYEGTNEVKVFNKNTINR